MLYTSNNVKDFILNSLKLNLINNLASNQLIYIAWVNDLNYQKKLCDS